MTFPIQLALLGSSQENLQSTVPGERFFGANLKLLPESPGRGEVQVASLQAAEGRI